MASSIVLFSDLVVCHGCDYLIEKQIVAVGRRARCPRCGTVIQRTIRNSVEKAIALSLAGLIIFFPAIYMPIMTFTVAGLHGTGNVIDAAVVLFEKDYLFVGVMVLMVSIVFPFIKLFLLFVSSMSIALGRVSQTTVEMFRTYKKLSEWGMVEVYMMGILVSIIKMYSMADIAYNTGFFCFIALVLLTISASTAVDEDYYWERIEDMLPGGDHPEMGHTTLLSDVRTAREAGLVRCDYCGKISLRVCLSAGESMFCPRCMAELHSRKSNSVNRTWALVICAAILYLPANILPMMQVNFMGTPEDSTILEGIIYFFQTGDYLVGGIILTASVLVPLFKIVGLIIILLSIHLRGQLWLKHKTGIFRFIEFIGRWSFIDIFVIALLGAMVQFGNLTTIGADPAARYFCAVVVCTMLAALTLDPRIIWDSATLSKKEEETECLAQS